MKIYRDITEQIITARQKKQITLEKVSHILNIKHDLLLRIEKGNFNTIKNNIYDLGHFRTYLKWLEIDPNKILHNFKAGKIKPKNKRNMPIKFPLIPFSKKYFVILFIAILFLLVFSWNKFYLKDLNINYDKEDKTNYEETNIEKKNTTNFIPNKNLNTSSILIRAVVSTWIQIERLDGSVYTSKILKKGETIEVYNEKNLTLITNNAGGIVITIDGSDIGKLGELGATQRNISLNAEDLLKKNNKI